MDIILYMIVPFIISVLITPIIKYIAFHLKVFAGFNERTIHTKIQARMGGVAIYIAFIISMALFVKVDNTFNAILIGGTIMFFTGLLDDMINLKPIQKFALQIIATIVVMWMGGLVLNVIRLPLGIVINMGFISVIVTFFWITGITNAVNLMDGLDGLAGGVVTIILIVIASLAAMESRMDVTIMSLILAGATLGVLVFNIYPASIFIGDCGALFLGFIIASISLLGFKSSTAITLGLPILLLLIPIIDTISAILRRKLSGKKASEADRNHLHHILMKRFGHRNTVLLLYTVTALFGLIAYIYIFNKIAGLLVMIVAAIGLELLIEVSHMISKQYHPLLSFISMVKIKILKVFQKSNCK